jgi:hypothetical protein
MTQMAQIDTAAPAAKPPVMGERTAEVSLIKSHARLISAVLSPITRARGRLVSVSNRC